MFIKYLCGLSSSSYSKNLVLGCVRVCCPDAVPVVQPVQVHQSSGHQGGSGQDKGGVCWSGPTGRVLPVFYKISQQADSVLLDISFFLIVFGS